MDDRDNVDAMIRSLSADYTSVKVSYYRADNLWVVKVENDDRLIAANGCTLTEALCAVIRIAGGGS